MQDHGSKGRLPLRCALAAYLFVAIAYFVPGASWSPASRFALTRAIVEHGSLEITPFASSTGDRAEVEGRFYSEKAPVPSFLAVPAYAAFHGIAKLRGRYPDFRAVGTRERPARAVRVSPAFQIGLYVCSVSTAGVAGVALGLVLYELLRKRIGARLAVLGAVTMVLGTPLFPYAASFFGHTIAAAGLLGAYAVFEAAKRPPTLLRALAVGLLSGLALGAEYLAAAAVVVSVGFMGWRVSPGHRVRFLAYCALGMGVPLAFLAIYHTACFGAPWRTGYSFVTHPAFAEGQRHGLLGIGMPDASALWMLLFGGARGLFQLSPICLLAVVGALHGWRRHRDPAMVLGGAVSCVLLLLNAGYFEWHGGWATGPRHSVPMLGFWGIGAGYAWAAPRLRVLAGVAGCVSVVVMTLTVAVALEAPPSGHAIADYLMPELRSGHIARIGGASNWGLFLGLGRLQSVWPVLLWIGGGAAGLVAVATEGPPDVR